MRKALPLLLLAACSDGPTTPPEPAIIHGDYSLSTVNASALPYEISPFVPHERARRVVVAGHLTLTESGGWTMSRTDSVSGLSWGGTNHRYITGVYSQTPGRDGVAVRMTSRTDTIDAVWSRRAMEYRSGEHTFGWRMQ